MPKYYVYSKKLKWVCLAPDPYDAAGTAIEANPNVEISDVGLICIDERGFRCATAQNRLYVWEIKVYFTELLKKMRKGKER